MTTVEATGYLAPYRRRRVRRAIRLRLTEDTYPLERSVEQSWLPIAFRAFERLAGQRPLPDGQRGRAEIEGETCDWRAVPHR